MNGSYYGKQECRVNKDEIEQEMTLLQEEITEMKEGEIFLSMDGNGKLGILNETHLPPTCQIWHTYLDLKPTSEYWP